MCNKCCICLEDLKEKGIVILDCGHIIHMSCFMELLKHDTIFCPMCRGKIKDNVNFYNYINLKVITVKRNMRRTYLLQLKNFISNKDKISIDLS